jgi:polysaccharide biosynthesis protein PslG
LTRVLTVLAAAAMVAAAVGCRSSGAQEAEGARVLAVSANDSDERDPAGRCTSHDGQPRHQRLGFSPGYTIISEDVAAVELDLDGMASTGVCWIRIDVDWSRIQPEPDRFEWASTDRAVAGARARGMEVLAMIGYTPAWARPDGTTDKHPPTDITAFSAFADAAARRYQSLDVNTWEVWNEPNLHAFWEPNPDPEAYARLLVATSNAIRAVDSEAFILSAGLSPAADIADGSSISPVTFLDRLYRAGAADSFDAVAMHPYSYPVNPAATVPLNHFAIVTPELREVMLTHGDEESRIWATEYGAPTGTSARAVGAGEQADFLADAVHLWDQWDWTGPLLIYAWRDRGTDPSDREQNFGLLDYHFTPKPSLAVLLSITARTGEPTPRGVSGRRPRPRTTVPSAPTWRP